MRNNQTHTIVNKWSGFFTAPGTYALVGPSGVGKTTLLRMLAGFEPLTAGSVMLCQEGCAQRELRPHDFSFISQFPALFDELSVYDNVRLAARIALQTEKAISSLLHKLGLSEVAYQRPYELSGGMQQRVSIAQAIVRNPRFIFADEPTASLDEDSKGVVLELLSLYAHEHNAGLIMSTHDAVVAAYAQVHLHMLDGTIVTERSVSNQPEASKSCSFMCKDRPLCKTKRM